MSLINYKGDLTERQNIGWCRNIHPHVHFALASSVGLLLELQPLPLLVFITSSTLLDLDIILSPLAPENNHRLLPSHWISLWIAIALIGELFFGLFLWVAAGALFHLLLDIWDWGLPILAPISLKLSPHLLPDPPADSNYSWKWFIQRYYENKLIITIEVLSVIIMLIVLISHVSLRMPRS